VKIQNREKKEVVEKENEKEGKVGGERTEGVATFPVITGGKDVG